MSPAGSDANLTGTSSWSYVLMCSFSNFGENTSLCVVFRIGKLSACVVTLLFHPFAASCFGELMHAPGNGATNAEYIALGNQARFQASGFVRATRAADTQDRFRGSMTLIDPHWAITSAHLFFLDGETWTPTLLGFGTAGGRSFMDQWGITVQPGQVFIHPGWRDESSPYYYAGDSNVDLALVYIPNAVVGIQPAPLYQGSMTSWAETFNIAATTKLYHVGYGVSSAVGSPLVNDTLRRGSVSRLYESAELLQGSNFSTLFSSPGTATYDYYDAKGEDGDSGSSNYVDVNGVMNLVGVLSSSTNGHGYESGTYSLDIRPYIPWIEQTMLSVPEPSSIILAGTGFVCVITMGCRKRRITRANRSPKSWTFRIFASS